MTKFHHMCSMYIKEKRYAYQSAFLVLLLSVITFVSGTVVHAQSETVQIDVSDELIMKINFWAKEDFFPSWALCGMFQDSRGTVWIQSGTQLCSFDGQYVKIVEEGTKGLYDFAITLFAEDQHGNIWRYFLQNGSDKQVAVDRITIYNPWQNSFESLQEHIGEDSLPPLSEELLLYSLGQQVYISDVEQGKVWNYHNGRLQLVFQGPKEQNHESFFYLAGPKGYYWAIGGKNSIHIQLVDEKGVMVADYSSASRHDKYNRDKKKYINNPFLSTNGQLWECHINDDGSHPQAYALPSEIAVSPLPPDQPVIPIVQIPSGEYGRVYLSGIHKIQAHTLLPFFIIRPQNWLELYGVSDLPFVQLSTLIADHLPEAANIPMHPETDALSLRDGTILVPTTGGLLQIEFCPRYFWSYLEGQSVRGLDMINPSTLAAARLMNFSSEAVEIDLSNGEVTSVFSELHSAPVYSITLDRDSIWLGLDDGRLQVCDNRWNPISIYSFPEERDYREARSLLRISDSIYWYTTTAGVIEANTLRKTSHYVIKQEGANWLHKDQKGMLWLGTENGLYNIQEERFYLDSLPGNHLPARISHIYEDEQNIFWMSTKSGLIKWQPYQKEFELFDESDGLPNRIVHAVYPDKLGRLWISTNNGIGVFEPNINRITSFSKIDGLPGNEQNFMSHTSAPDGRIFFGGTDGITLIDPEKIILQPDTLPYDFSLGNINMYRSDGRHLGSFSAHDIKDQKLINLPLPAWRLEFDLLFPNYSTKPYLVEWRQTGGEGAWQKVGKERKIVLYNNPYGSFEVQLRARYLNQKGNTKLRTISFFRPLPIYQRGWFYFALIGLSILMTIQITKSHSQRIKTRNEELQQAVNKQTRILQEQKNQLERLDQTKTVFFRNISHELRTPLTIIKTAAEEQLELELFKPKKEQQQAQLIINQTRHLQEMIERIMNLSKLESGLIQLNLESINWTSLIDTIVSSFTGIANHRQIHLQLIPSPIGPVYVRTDAKKIQHILSNLIGNALKFSAAGGHVLIRSQVMEQEIEIVVADNGRGIPVVEQEMIFKRYQQGLQGENSDFIGYGIGLALCAEYVQLLEGKVWVESVENEGASFFIRLPLKYTSEVNIPSPITSSAAEQKQEVRLLAKLLETKEERASVLIVEDNSHLQKQLEGILSKYYKVQTANNGKEAFDILHGQPKRFELLVTDVMMPLMDGFMLLKKIRSHDTLGFLPVLFLTALSLEDEKLRAFRLGVDGYLSKPFERIELLTRIDNLVQKQIRRKEFQHKNIIVQKNVDEPNNDSNQGLKYNAEWLKKLEKVVQKNLSRSNFKVSEIAHILNLTERTLRNHVKSYTGLTPLSYLRKARLDQALLHISQQRYLTVSEVAYSVGFKDVQYFSKLFKKAYGKLPKEYM